MAVSISPHRKGISLIPDGNIKKMPNTTIRIPAMPAASVPVSSVFLSVSRPRCQSFLSLSLITTPPNPLRSMTLCMPSAACRSPGNEQPAGSQAIKRAAPVHPALLSWFKSELAHHDQLIVLHKAGKPYCRESRMILRFARCRWGSSRSPARWPRCPPPRGSECRCPP